MSVVDTVKADPSLRHRTLVGAADPGGSCANAAGGRVAIPGESLGKSAVGCAACLLFGLVLCVDGSTGAHVAVFLGFPLAVVVVVGGRRWTNGGGDAVVVGGAAVGARPVLPQVRVAALLGPALGSLRVLETHRKVDDQTGGPGTTGSSAGIPLCAVFPKGRRNLVFL